MKILNPEEFKNEFGQMVSTVDISTVIGEPGEGKVYSLSVGESRNLPPKVCAELIKVFPWLITEAVAAPVKEAQIKEVSSKEAMIKHEVEENVEVTETSTDVEVELPKMEEKPENNPLACSKCSRVCKSEFGRKVHERACKK